MERPSKEAQLLLAIQAIQKDPTLSVRAAAKIYNVPETTLRDRQRGILPRRDIPANSRKLTDSEEKAIVQYILDLDSRAFPPRLSSVEDMANRLLAERDASGALRVGINWASKFIKRQPQLCTRLNRRIDYQRVQCEDPIQYRKWFRLVSNTIAKYGIDASDIYNFDETGFAMGLISSTGMVVTSIERRGRPRQKQQGNREWATVIQAVGAQGRIIPPYVIVAGKNHLSNWYENSPFPLDWRIAVTDNGWTTNEKGLEWVQHFDQHTKGCKKGVYRLLILDGHESHHSTEFEVYCKKNNIVTLCMPAHSSHRLQPLDVGCFGPLKAAYSRQIERLMKLHFTHISKVDFFHAFHAAFLASITEANILGGFRGSGLVPLDPEHVISKLEVVFRTPSPPRSPGLASTFWVSKTPSTALEATSQSEFIKKRISSHQSSSPTSIYQAVDQLTKGTQGIMHEVALLKARVEELEEANATLSKRRKAKKRRICNGGSLTAQDGKDLTDQRRVEEELREERRRSRGQGQRVTRRVARCRRCGTTGHNSRNCPAAEETAVESTIEVAN
ncbi:hypothetical protein NPX13_g11344 [Xylaria arbuscula]|uniref:Transposase n=1 Tax=Xylaria arbuscula TaxID=114810 RepID=A0A9W8TH15_9PEZI|nr:hypothetical protein NPX13_g11344 [Xylaria arbuscula]